MRLPNFSFSRNLVASLSAVAFMALPLVASAQQPYGDQPPPYGQQQPYTQPPAPYGNQQSVKGTVSGFDGQWVVYMHDEKGYTDHITLHQGTIINPTGIKLLEGMHVTVYGYAQGSTFQANRIDVAYSPYSPYYGSNGQPAYGYGDQGYGYGGGYGPYGGGYSPYGYGYGGYGAYPYFGFGINWGWGWGWGWPGYAGWGWPYYGYYGGYPYYCCGGYYGGYPGRYYPPPGHGGGGGSFPGGHGTIHGNTGGGTMRGAPGGGGSMHAAPVSGGGSMHAGGRPPRR